MEVRNFVEFESANPIPVREDLANSQDKLSSNWSRLKIDKENSFSKIAYGATWDLRTLDSMFAA
jgi:hypothetical protein